MGWAVGRNTSFYDYKRKLLKKKNKQELKDYVSGNLTEDELTAYTSLAKDVMANGNTEPTDGTYLVLRTKRNAHYKTFGK